MTDGLEPPLEQSFWVERHASDRIPTKDITGAMQGIEILFEHRKHALSDTLGRPAGVRVRGPDGTRLGEQEYLIVSHAKDLASDRCAGVAAEGDHEGRDTLGRELFQSLDALFLLRRIFRNRTDHAGPGEGSDGVGAHVEALYVERDGL